MTVVGGVSAGVHPRFSSSSPNRGKLFNVADSFLNKLNHIPTQILESKALGWTQRLAVSKNPVVALPFKLFTWAVKLIEPHDYHELIPISFMGGELGPFKIPRFHLGRVAVEPPAGALVIITYGAILGGRITHALKRAMNGDRREVRDILVRDIPSITITLFGLDYVVRKISNLRQQFRGIEMVKDRVFSYSQLDNVFRLTDENRLEALLTAKSHEGQFLNHKGINIALKDVKRRFYQREFSPAMRFYFNRFQLVMENAMKQAAQNKGVDINPMVKRAYKYLLEMEALRGEVGALATPRMRHSVLDVMTHHVPSFTEIFSGYAKRARNLASFLSFAVVIFLLGMALPMFNQFFTEREYKRTFGDPKKKNSGSSGLNSSAKSVVPQFQPQYF